MGIYTKTGDKGETSLFGGNRVGKTSGRIRLLGSFDELNSFIGLLLSCLPKDHHESEFLQSIQSALFEMGTEVANPKLELSKFKDYDSFTSQMEKRIDEMDENLEPLRNFILPGGCISASYSHICRALTRKCERRFFYLSRKVELNESAGRFLNRLSDYFFTLARNLNRESGVEDVVWRSKSKEQ